MSQTPEPAAVAALQRDIDRVIAANLQDPDLAGTSPDYRAGYDRGFREAAAAFVAFGLKKAEGSL